MIGYLIRLQSSPSSVRHRYSGRFTIETVVKSIFYYGQSDSRYLTEFSRVGQKLKSVKIITAIIIYLFSLVSLIYSISVDSLLVMNLPAIRGNNGLH